MPLSQTDKAILKRQIKRAESLEYLECRVGGTRHRWYRCRPDIEPDYGVAVVHQCDACLCIKRTVIAKQTGEILGRTYEYPDGYLVHLSEADSKLEKAITPAAVRVALLDRETDLAEIQPMRESDNE